MKKVIILSLMLILFFTMASISASDDNEILLSSEDSELIPIEESINQNTDDIISVNNISSTMENKSKNTDYLSICNDNEIISDSSDDLNDIIQNASEGSVIYLNSDYTFSSSLSINKNITIVGNGHTFDGNKNSHIMISKYNTIQFDNIKFINWQSNYYGGVFWNSGTLILNKCTFENNYCLDIQKSKYFKGSTCSPVDTYSRAYGGAIYNEGNLNIANCNFKKNYVRSKNTATISYSYFGEVKDYSYSYGGAIYNAGNLNIYNSNFDENVAQSVTIGTIELTGHANNIMFYSYSYGGAIYNTGALNITYSKFNKNTAESRSYCEGSEKYSFCKSYCFSNSYGGTIYNLKNLIINNSDLLENIAYSYTNTNYNSTIDSISDSYSYGGAIYNKGTSILSKVTMNNNKAIINSNIIKITDSTANVDIYNYAKTYGGSIYNIGDLTAIAIKVNNFYAGDIFKVTNTYNVKVHIYQEIYGSFIYNAGKLTMGGNIFYDDTYMELFGSNYVKNAQQSIYGGVIYNTGDLNILNSTFKRTSDSTIYSNLNNNNNYNKQVYGGLIYNEDTLYITNSSFNNNFKMYNYSWVYGSYIYNKGVFRLNNSNLSIVSKNASIFNTNKINSFLVYNTYLSGFTIINSRNTIQIYDSSLINIDLNNSFCNCNFNYLILDKVLMIHKNNNLTINNSNIISYSTISIEKSVNTFNNNTFKTSGIVSLNSTLNLNNCSFTSCHNNMYGGAISCSGSSIKIFNSSFSFNRANYGGAISCSGSSIKIFNSNFRYNTAIFKGGAIYSSDSSDLIVCNSTFMYNKANDEGGALNVYKLNANNCTFIKNNAISCAAVKVINPGSLVNCSLFYRNSVNDKTNNADYICYLNKGTIINSIFLNNTANSLFYKSSVFDYNWFGSTVNDYLIKPINDTSLNNWLYLDIIHEESLRLGEKNPIQFLLYMWDGNNICNYNSLNLYESELLVTCTDGNLDKNSITPNEIMLYTPNKVGKCNITVKFFDKELTINLTCKYPSKIIANESITIFVDQIMNFDDNGLCTKLISSGIGELIYLSDNDAILNILDNGFKGITSGIANIIIEFKGNDEYAPTKTLVPITVLKSDVEIITNDIVMNYTDSETININSTKDIKNFIFKSNDENIAIVNNNGLISAVGVGNTTINIIFEGNEKYHATNKTVNIIINKKNSSIILNKDISFTYGNLGYIQIDSTQGCSDFNVSVLNHPEAKIILNNQKIEVSNLDVGDYTLLVTTIPLKNYLSVNVTCHLSVSKGIANSYIPKTFEYDGSIIVNVICDGAIGLCDVEVKDHPEALIEINDTSIIISGLDVGTYTLFLTTVPDKNHIGVKSSPTFTIIKADSEIEFSNKLLFNYGSSDNTVVKIKYATNITDVFVPYHPEAIINIVNNIITVSGLNVGNYTLCVSTVPDKNHNAVIGSTKITVNKAFSTLNIENDIIFDYGSFNSTYITFTGAKSIKANVTDNSATVTIDGGKITVSNLNAGNYSLYVYTVPDDNHFSVNATVKIIVKKINPKITVSPVIFDYGQFGSTTILTNDKINFEAEVINHPEAIVNISNKIITISHLEAGNYKLEVNTYSTNNYNQITLTTDITVVKILPTIKVSDIVFDYGASCSTKVILNGTSNFNVNINGDSNHLTVNGDTIIIFGLDAGTYDLFVTTVPDTNHKAVTSVSKVIVNKLDTVLTSADVIMVYGTSKNIIVKLNDVNKNLLIGETVKVTFNNVVYTTVVNSNGQAIIPIPNLAVKSYTTTIDFYGNKNYEKSTTTVKIIVKKATPKITTKSKTFKKSVKTKMYTITLKDNNGKAIKGKKIILKIKGKTYKANTNKKGVAKFKINKLNKKGSFIVTIRYAGDKCYNKVTKKVKIKIK